MSRTRSGTFSSSFSSRSRPAVYLARSPAKRMPRFRSPAFPLSASSPGPGDRGRWARASAERRVLLDELRDRIADADRGRFGRPIQDPDLLQHGVLLLGGPDEAAKRLPVHPGPVGDQRELARVIPTQGRSGARHRLGEEGKDEARRRGSVPRLSPSSRAADTRRTTGRSRPSAGSGREGASSGSSSACRPRRPREGSIPAASRSERTDSLHPTVGTGSPAVDPPAGTRGSTGVAGGIAPIAPTISPLPSCSHRLPAWRVRHPRIHRRRAPARLMVCCEVHGK